MSSNDFPVIYLTGAPATGKSTLSRGLAAKFPQLRVFSYSEELRHFIANDASKLLSENEIRERSGNVVTAEDVFALDQLLIGRVQKERLEGPFLIDSHPVTKEPYGFRATCFDANTLRSLNPDVIICLYTLAEVALDRIRRDPMGRPLVSVNEAEMHTSLQTSVAVHYGVITGKPVYFVDSSVSRQHLVEIISQKAHLQG